MSIKLPCKRNEKLFFSTARTPVTYVKKLGLPRPNYVVVKFPDGVLRTVWRQDLYRTASPLCTHCTGSTSREDYDACAGCLGTLESPDR